MEKKYNTSKFVGFVKKNIYYFLMIACIIAIGTMITIAAINGINNDDPNAITVEPGPVDPNLNNPPEEDDPIEEEPTITPIVFAMPVVGAEIGNDYCVDALMFNTTLQQWQTHNGIDLKAPIGTDVLAAYDGMVKSIETDILNGTTIVIEHDNDMQTIYSSLAPEVDVMVNQMVNKGDVIGKVSNTALAKTSEGPLLHFQVKVNNEYTDPNVYLPIENK